MAIGVKKEPVASVPKIATVQSDFLNSLRKSAIDSPATSLSAEGKSFFLHASSNFQNFSSPTLFIRSCVR